MNLRVEEESRPCPRVLPCHLSGRKGLFVGGGGLPEVNLGRLPPAWVPWHPFSAGTAQAQQWGPGETGFQGYEVLSPSPSSLSLPATWTQGPTRLLGGERAGGPQAAGP